MAEESTGESTKDILEKIINDPDVDGDNKTSNERPRTAVARAMDPSGKKTPKIKPVRISSDDVKAPPLSGQIIDGQRVRG